MAVVFRTAGAWGFGLGGRRLTNVEVDSNFWDLLQRVQALETTPVTPVSIESIAYADGGITITLNNAATYGPFPLPIATFNYRDLWLPLTDYSYLDIVNVPLIGLFLILQAHTSAAAFDRTAVGDDLQPLYRQLTGVPRDIAYDVSFAVIGSIPNDSSPLHIFLADRAVTFPADMTGSRAYLLTACTTASLVFPVEVNGVQVGTITFNPDDPYSIDETGGQTGVFDFAFATALAAGDRMVVRAPDTLDYTAADLVVNMAGVRSDL